MRLFLRLIFSNAALAQTGSLAIIQVLQARVQVTVQVIQVTYWLCGILWRILREALLGSSLSLQMVDRLVVQLQDLISDLRLSKDTDVKNEMKTAKNYIQDADKLKQVRKM